MEDIKRKDFIAHEHSWCGAVDRRDIWTGQYFKNNEPVVTIITCGEAAKQYHNVVISKTAFDMLNASYINDKNLLEAIWSHKMPSLKFSDEELTRKEAFTKAAYNMGYIRTTYKAGILKCYKPRTTCVLSFNIQTENIQYDDKRKKGLFDGMFDKQVVTNVYNEYHKLLEDGKHDDYNAVNAMNKCISTAIEETEEIMGR